MSMTELTNGHNFQKGDILHVGIHVFSFNYAFNAINAVYDVFSLLAICYMLCTPVHPNIIKVTYNSFYTDTLLFYTSSDEELLR